MGTKDEIRFLSRSILLEESGLPRMSGRIIVIVFFGLMAFILWASFMPLSDVVKGSASINEHMGSYEASVYVPMEYASLIAKGQSVRVISSTVGSRIVYHGQVKSVKSSQMMSNSPPNQVIAIATLSIAKEQTVWLDSEALEQLPFEGEIVIGSKSLLASIVGPIFSWSSALNERR